MKRVFALVCALCLLSAYVQAQKMPTMEEWLSGAPRTYTPPTNNYAYQWWGDNLIQAGRDTIFTVNPANGKAKRLLTREEVNRVMERNRLPQLSTLTNVQFLWPEERWFLINVRTALVVFDFATHTLTRVTELKASANMDYEKTTGHVAYTIDNNLYVDAHQVTNEPEGFLCGQSVHRNEFGINKGTFWSPKGARLAFYKMDESMVSQYPLVNTATRISEVDNVRYPMAGMTSHKVYVGVYDPTTKETVYLQTGDPTDRYFTNISWSPDEKSVYLIELNRDQNHSKLCRYDAQTGEMKEMLYEEKHSKYVEPQNPIVFLPWDETKFIYQSQRDGWNHLYLFDTAGNELGQLTTGDWIVKSLVGFHTKKKQAIITSTEVSPLQTNTYTVAIPSGKRTPVGNAEGVHSVSLSASGKYVIDLFTTPTQPRRTELVSTENAKSKAGLLLRETTDPFAGYTVPDAKVGTIKAADGQTDLYYRLITPPNMEPNKKYPVIVYVYGGPHNQLITNTYAHGARGWYAYMANQGYVVFTLDNRGSSNRGLEFENVTFRHLGVKEAEDQAKGIEFLKTLPYIDGNRIGVHGWSYGGYMTTNLMLRYPELYKVGVGGGPVIDWQYYEVMYGERYMDTPQTNPAGYESSSMNRMAGNLKGRLLIIHGDHDETCVPQHSITFLKACVDAGTFPDFFLYPGHKHGVGGRDRLHLYKMISRYFEEHL
ncbi:MAG: DPP IV N-terminal domain-containing protein [Prevotellaceae bacterium]|nr:DPP IV N-terminal domain-containing protein [Prevotellaceae bacterium]